MAKINVDSLVTALSHEKVLDALGKIVQNSIDAAFSEKLDSLSRAFESLQTELKQRNAQIDTLTKKNAELKTQIRNQNLQIEKLEAYNRQENLIVQGLPVSYAQAATTAAADGDDAVEHSADTELKFLTLCGDKLGLQLKPSDISICHRLPKSAKQQFPPVIVRFTNRKARTAVLQARKKLRGTDTPVYINEHLTRSAATLFSNARKLLKESKLGGVWTKNGQVIIKSLDGHNSVVNFQSDLDGY
jgi:hypothetical protein